MKLFWIAIILLTIAGASWLGLEGYNRVAGFAETVKNARELR